MEERENTIEFEVRSDALWGVIIRNIEDSMDSLWERPFVEGRQGTFKFTIVFTPEGEENA